MFVVGGINARLLGDIQAADDAEAISHRAVRPRHFGVARSPLPSAWLTGFGLRKSLSRGQA